MIFEKKKKDNLSDFNPNEKINYNEFDLLDELNIRAFQSFALTLDKEDFVPVSFLDQVCKWIYKTEKKRYKKLKKANKAYQKWFKENLPKFLEERRQKQFQEQVEVLRAQEGQNAGEVLNDQAD